MRFTRDEVAASVAAEPGTAAEPTNTASSKKQAGALRATGSIRPPRITRFAAPELIWALGSLCSLHQRNFSAEMLVHEFPPETLEASEAAPSYSESVVYRHCA